MPFERSYLFQVRQKNKRLFAVISLFIVFTLVISITRNEITPFYVWSMYSAPAPETDLFSMYSLEYNDGRSFIAPHTWEDHKRMMFYYTIGQYTWYQDSAYINADKIRAEHILAWLHINPRIISGLYDVPADMDKYPAWLKRYMQDNTGIKMDSIKVYRKWLRYTGDGHVQPVNKELLLKA